MRDKPILMSAPMVRALLDGRKTQTRRLAWLTVEIDEDAKRESDQIVRIGLWPKVVVQRPTIWQSVKPGDRLWVRETWAGTCNVNSETDWPGRPSMPTDPDSKSECVIWRSDGDWEWCDDNGFLSDKSHWKPSIHMPRKFSRLTLLVTAAKMERVREINGIEALAEGVEREEGTAPWRMYCRLWKSLYTKPGTCWEDNPEVVAITFDVKRGNIDE